MSFKRTIDQLYTECFPPDGIDPYNIKPREEKFVFARATKILSFFGVANQQRYKKQTNQTAKSVFKNLIGWDDEATSFWFLITILLAPIIFLYQLSRIIFSPFVNVFKLFAEFIPSLISKGFGSVAQNIEEWIESDKRRALLLLPLAIWGVGKAVQMVFGTIRFLARAASSPVNGYYGASKLGESWSNDYGKFWGMLLGGVSVAISILVFAFILPIAMGFVPASSVSFLPESLSKALEALDNLVIPLGDHVMGPFYRAIGVQGVLSTAGYGVIRLVSELVFYPLGKTLFSGEGGVDSNPLLIIEEPSTPLPTSSTRTMVPRLDLSNVKISSPADSPQLADKKTTQMPRIPLAKSSYYRGQGWGTDDSDSDNDGFQEQRLYAKPM